MNKFIIIIVSLFLVLYLPSCKTTENSQKEKTFFRKKNKQLSLEEKTVNTGIFIEAKKELILGNYETAESLFLFCLKKDPSNSAAMYELAKIYRLMKNYNKALMFAKKAVEIDAQNIWYQQLYGNILQNTGDYSNAAKVYENLIKDNPDKYDFYFQLADLYIHEKKYNEALKIYNNLENKTGVTEDVSLQKEKIYFFLKKPEKAIKEIDNLIEKFPKETKYLGLKAEIYISENKDENAFEIYNKILLMEPNNPFVHLSLADYYQNKGDNEKSFEEIKLAFLNPELNIDKKISILLKYFTITEKYTDLKIQAFELIDILIKVHPDEAKVYSIYSDFLNREKKFTEAKDALLKVISLDSTKYIVWEQLLIIESQLEDYKAMANESKRAMELFPEQFMTYYFNGIANYSLKNYEKTVESIKLGLNFVGNNKSVNIQMLTFLGDSYNHLKKYDESYDTYDKIIKLDPENVYVLNNYSYYLSLRNKNLEHAEKMSKKTNEINPYNSTYQDTYAWILYKMKKYEDAKIWIEKAIKNGGEKSAVILEHYGDIIYKLGDIEKAHEIWEKAKKTGTASEFLDRKIKDKKLYEMPMH